MKGLSQVVGLLLVVFGFVCATTYPYSFLKNHVVLTAQSAVFDRLGLLVWPEGSFSSETRRIYIRLNVRAAGNNQTGPARILTISRDHHHSNLTIGQERSDLIIRLRRSRINELGVPAFVIPAVFNSPSPQTIETVVTQRTLTVLLNGTEVLSHELDSNPFRYWDPKYSLALGNEHTWERPWIGEINTAQIIVDEATVNLLDDDTVLKAGLFHLLRYKVVLFSSSIADLFVNFVVMLPAGAITAWTFRQHRIAWSLGFWFVAAAIVEVTQSLIPGRIPAISDLILNVGGAGIGAWMIVGFTERRQRRR